LLEDPGFITEEDFAAGDRGKGAHCWRTCQLHRILSPDDPLFDTAYSLLWDQFSAAGEMEQHEVIARRLLRRTNPPAREGIRTFYEMGLVLDGDTPAAVRDHTTILPEEADSTGAIVHLSHNLLMPQWRRTGLAAWMRALPAACAREAIRQEGRPGAIILVAEMEPMDAGDAARCARLAAYEAAGFKKVDPAAVVFWQPDFRPEAESGSKGFQPIALHLVLRFCGREDAGTISGSEVRQIVDALYGMYALELSAQNIELARRKVVQPAAEEQVALLPPTFLS